MYNDEKIKQLAELAEEFELVAEMYSSDINVRALLKALESLLSRAKNGQITGVINYVPGAYFFQEKDLSKYPDLEVAHSKFYLALTIENDRYDELIAWAEKRKKQLFRRDQ